MPNDNCQYSPLEILNFYFETTNGEQQRSNLFSNLNEQYTWDSIFNTPNQRNIIPFLSYAIAQLQKKTTLDDLCPEKWKKTLKQTQYNAAVNSLIIFSEYDKIIKATEQKEIPLIPLKGIFLADKLYPKRWTRPMGDIDILVSPDNREKAATVLKTQGYTGAVTKNNFTANKTTYKHFHDVYCKNVLNKTIIVELHTGLARTLFHTNNHFDFWEETISLSAELEHTFQPKKELLLLHLLWHAYQHMASDQEIRLGWLLDIALLIDEYKGLQWDYLQEKAKQWQMIDRVYLVLKLTASLFYNSTRLQNIEIQPPVMKQFFFKKLLTNLTTTNNNLVNSILFNLLTPRFIKGKLELNLQGFFNKKKVTSHK